MKKCAVIILNWNGRDFLRRFLPSVLRYSEDCDVYVADNGSEDGSVGFVRDNFNEAKVWEFDRNYGFAEGYNKAISLVENEYVCLLNSDVEVGEGWYKAPLEYLDSHPECAACQPKILQVADKHLFEFAGASGGFIDALGYPFCRGRIIGTVEADEGQYDTPAKVFWATGACMFVRRSDYLAYGGLDARFIAHQEEIDLCWRFNARGRYVAAVPQSAVYHVGGGTLKTDNPYKTYLNFRNNLLLLYKNLADGSFYAVCLLRFFLDMFASFVFLLQGKSGDAVSVFKAWRDFLKLRSGFSRDRKRNLELTVVRKPEGWYNGSVVVNYYLLGLRKFQDFMPNKS